MRSYPAGQHIQQAAARQKVSAYLFVRDNQKQANKQSTMPALFVKSDKQTSNDNKC